tara:strand:- start:8003 stop:8506 length:504 start_codon:yes stop_codon:yes gene_type:complete
MKTSILILAIFLIGFISAIDYDITEKMDLQNFTEFRLEIGDAFLIGEQVLKVEGIGSNQTEVNFKFISKKDTNIFTIEDKGQIRINMSNYYYSIGAWLIKNNSASIVVAKQFYTEKYPNPSPLKEKWRKPLTYWLYALLTIGVILFIIQLIQILNKKKEEKDIETDF